MVRQISADELKRLLSSPELQLVDVREPHEHARCTIDGAHLIPMMKLMRGGETHLDPAKPTVCYCHHGSRSQRCAQYLVSKGFAQVHNLSGGIHSWAKEVDPEVGTY